MTVEAAAPSAPAETAAPAAPATEASPYSPAADDAAGLAAYRAAIAGTNVVTPAEVPAVVPVAEPTKPAETPVADPVDAKLEKLFGRVSTMEAERQAERVELEAARAKVAKYEALHANVDTDPDALFKELKWDSESLKNYILGGKPGLSPKLSAVEQRIADLEAKLAAVPETIAKQRDQAVQAGLPAMLKAETFPYISALFPSPEAAAEHVMGVISHARREQKVELTPEDAALAVERNLGRQHEAFNRATKQVPRESTPATPKPITPSLNNGTASPQTTLPYNPEEHTDEENLAQAVKMMRASASQ